MLFYEIKDKLEVVDFKNINKENLTVGIINSLEIDEVGKFYDFDQDTIDASKNINTSFRSSVDVRNDYSFSELRIFNKESDDDYIALFIKHNLLLIVDILDEDESTKNSLIAALQKYPGNKVCLEKLIGYFILSLLNGSNNVSEELRNKLTEMEELVVNNTTEKEFNINLLNNKKIITNYYNYYNQLLDIIETLEDNDNEILKEENIIYITNLYSKVNRFKGDIDNLNDTVEHLQDAYNTLLDQKLNNTMKIFTIMTSIFFPLTVIVGWYGMNFANMPELTWKYGYVYVIVLSLVTSITLTLVAKKKKWF